MGPSRPTPSTKNRRLTRLYFGSFYEQQCFSSVLCNLGFGSDIHQVVYGMELGRGYSPFYIQVNANPNDRLKLNAAKEGYNWGGQVGLEQWSNHNERMEYAGEPGIGAGGYDHRQVVRHDLVIQSERTRAEARAVWPQIPFGVELPAEFHLEGETLRPADAPPFRATA